MTPEQIEPQTHQCDCCGMPAGTMFYTHPYSNKLGPDGVEWGNAARCLCQKCSAATVTMTCLKEYLDYKRNSQLKEFDDDAVQELEVM